MDVRCERCRAQYAFEDDQITPAGLTVQCNGCGHVFRIKKKELVVNFPVNPDELDELPRPASSAGRQPPLPPQSRPAPQPHHWTIRRASGQTLSFSELNTLQRWIVERKVAREDEVTQGDGAWVRLGTLAELQSFFDVVEAADRAQGHSTSRYPAAPYPPADAMPAAPAPRPAQAPPPPRPPPAADPASHAELDEADLHAVGKSSPSRTRWVVAVLLLATCAAAAYVFMPALFNGGPPPRPVEAPPVAAKPPEPPPPVPEPKPEPQPEVKPPEPEPAPPEVKAAEARPEPEPKPKPKARAPSAAQLLAEAGRLRDKGLAEQALDLYGKLAAQDPDNAEALAGRGLCYFDLEQYAPAEASLREALRLSPGQADALMGLAQTLRAQGRKAEAITMFERYLAAHPGGDEAALARNAINQLKE